ncbi:MAG: hypothetical protein WBP47_02840, partial [Candidatus Promineifilaceae bacterium]
KLISSVPKSKLIFERTQRTQRSKSAEAFLVVDGPNPDPKGGSENRNFAPLASLHLCVKVF